VLVKALCKEYGFPMIRVSPSTILRKYVGESQQHLKAAFTLAMKMQPCIMFFDEVDSIFRMRADDDIMVERELKTEGRGNSLINRLYIF
jgi:SpoVK/Ycf46/Vps4 family AAA+-type ATPase